MSTNASKIVPGCYCAEAMGFKVWQHNGSVLCCAELVLTNYNNTPEEVSAWFNIVNKKTNEINKYALNDINELGRAVGNKDIANADEFVAKDWTSIGFKASLNGRACYLFSYIKILPSGFKLNTFRVIPSGKYPSFEENIGDDVPWGSEDIVNDVDIEEVKNEEIEQDDLPF